MVGFKADGTIHDIAVMEQKETPGLGTKITEADFYNQFLGADPAKFNLGVGNGGDVEAISGATVSSKAYAEAVERAYETYMKNKDKLN
jgi:electron transport complex protein RnfG